jgi:hypothetical protein
MIESDTHPDKHLSSKNSTDAGIMISIKPVLRNVDSSIRDNLDPDSNRTEESDLHPEKHRSSKNSTDEGIMVSTKRVSRNALFSIRDMIGAESKGDRPRVKRTIENHVTAIFESRLIVRESRFFSVNGYF